MAGPASKLPTKTPELSRSGVSPQRVWHPFGNLRDEVDRLFGDFNRDFFSAPYRRSAFEIEPAWGRLITEAVPAVDVVEKEKSFEIAVELPGLNERDVEVSIYNGNLTIKGEKKEEKEEKQKGYHLSERRYGSFARSFRVPEDVDAEKIEANFKNGVLTITLPKTAEAQKLEKKVAIKSA